MERPDNDPRMSKSAIAQERGGASPPFGIMRVVRWKPAGLRPAALALSSRPFLLLLDDSPLDFGRIGDIALVLRTRCMDNVGSRRPVARRSTDYLFTANPEKPDSSNSCR